MRNGLEQVKSEYLRSTLSRLQDGLLELLRSKISDNQSTGFPITYVTDRVEKVLMKQIARDQRKERHSGASNVSQAEQDSI